MVRRLLLCCLGVSLAASLGCAQLRELKKQNASLRDKLLAAERQRDGLLSEKEALQVDRTQLSQELAGAQRDAQQAKQVVAELDAERMKLEDQRRELQSLVRGLAGIDVRGTDEGNFFVLESDILFDLGKTDLKDDAKRALDKVAQYLRTHEDQAIRVDGHTDGVPIRVSQWKDNYHLGAMRAHAVMQYLAERGVGAERMFIAGFGPNRPAVQPEAPNEAVAANRRVEIFLVPTTMRSIGEILDKFRR